MKQSSMQKIEDWLRASPNDAELLFIYGRGKEALGDYDAAMKAYEQAEAIDPNINPQQLQPRLRALKGGVPIGAKTGQSAGSAGSLTAPAGKAQGSPGGSAPAGAASPSQAAAAPKSINDLRAYDAAEAKLRAGDAAGAEKDLTDLVNKNQSDGHAWLMLGRISEKKGDLDQASTNYRMAAMLKEAGAQDALNQVNSSRVLPILAEADKQIQEKNLSAASSSLKDAIMLAPQRLDLHRKLSDVLKQMGDDKEAEREKNLADGKKADGSSK
jgi:Flp pilus assembly protein TadD